MTAPQGHGHSCLLSAEDKDLRSHLLYITENEELKTHAQKFKRIIQALYKLLHLLVRYYIVAFMHIRNLVATILCLV